MRQKKEQEQNYSAYENRPLTGYVYACERMQHTMTNVWREHFTKNASKYGKNGEQFINFVR